MFEIPPTPHSEAQYRQCLGRYLLAMALLLSPVLISLVFLSRMGELTPYTAVVQEQGQRNAVYGPGTSIVYYPYKRAMIQAQKPRILSLGSSRALGLRHELFNTSFTNAAQAISTPEQALHFLQEILAFHKPDVLLLSLDFWWFNESAPPDRVEFPTYNPAEVTLHKLIKPYTLIAEGHLDWADLVRVTLWGDRQNMLGSYDNLGMMALKTGNGTKPDGSVFWGQYGLNDPDHYDARFKTTLDYIQTGTNHFIWGQDYAEHKLAVLRELVALCRQQGIELYVILPPVANTVYRHMTDRPEQYRYVGKLQSALRQLQVPVADFIDLNRLQSSDCEFIDGYHPGDVTYLRMLLAMADQADTAALSRYLNLDWMRQKLAQHAGYAMVPGDETPFRTAEQDFLKLGCRK